MEATAQLRAQFSLSQNVVEQANGNESTFLICKRGGPSDKFPTVSSDKKQRYRAPPPSLCPAHFLQRALSGPATADSASTSPILLLPGEEMPALSIFITLTASTLALRADLSWGQLFPSKGWSPERMLNRKAVLCV